MGVMPVNRLLITMSLPMMISMLVQALYNVVDSVFVSYISEDALAAVGLAFPAQNLMISVAVGTGVGINALLSKSLGEKNYDTANRTAVNGIFLAFCSWVVFAVLGGLFSRTFMELQTPVESIADYGTTYLAIVSVVSVGMMFQICFERLLQSTGKTIYTMISQAVGAIINIIMDPLLIFGIGPFPQMGIAGAAWATVLGQIVGALLGLYCNLRRNPEISISFRGFRPSGAIIRKIYAVGVPSIIMSSIGSVMVFGMNKILIAFTTTATAVFGVYFKLQSFVFMPVFGLNNGMVPIVAYNYGARRPDRIKQTIKLSVIYAVSIMFIGLLIFQFLPNVLLDLFRSEQDTGDMLTIGVPALRIISLSFLFAGYAIVCSSVFQALGNGVYSLIISVARQLVCILPLAWFFARTFGLHAVWLSLPLAEITSVVLSSILFRKIYLDKIKPLGQAAA